MSLILDLPVPLQFLSNPLLSSQILRHSVFNKSSNQAPPPLSVCWWSVWEARRARLRPRPGWFGSFPPCQQDPSTCRQPFFYIYAHSQQIKTISRGYATESAILVLAADCVWHGMWDKTLGLMLHDCKVAQVFQARNRHPGVLIESAWTVLSDKLRRGFASNTIDSKVQLLIDPKKTRHIHIDTSTRCRKSPHWSEGTNL